MPTRTVVAAPSCAGKTNYYDEHARTRDLVLDADVIGSTAMRLAIADLERRVVLHQNVWVIRSLPGQARRTEFTARLHADELVLLWPDTDVLLTRAQRRPHPTRHIAAVRAWRIDRARAPRRGPEGPRPR